MSLSGANRPRLKVSYNKKIENDFQYCKNWVDYIYNSSVFAGRDKSHLQLFYDIANNHMSEDVKKFFTRITNPYNFEKEKHKNFPAKIEMYNITRPILDFLWGEKLGRPFNYIVTTIGSDTEGRKNEERNKMLLEIIGEIVEAEQDGEEGPSLEELEKKEENFETSYKDKLAIIGQDVLEYIVSSDRVKEKFQEMFKHFTISGESYSYTYVHNEDVKTRQISPFAIDYCKDGESQYVEDADWVIRREWWSPNRILDELYNELTDEHIKRLDNANSNAFYHVFSDYYQHYSGTSYDSILQRDKIEVVHCQWRTFRKVGQYTYIDPLTMEEETVLVDETFKKEKDDTGTLKWIWVNEVWEGYRIDGGSNGYAKNDITSSRGFYLGFKPIDYQRNEMNNHAESKLAYNGRMYSNLHSEPNSIVKMILPWQVLYIIVMYRLEMSIAKSKGQIAFTFVEAIPNGEGDEEWQFDDFLYYSEALGMGLLSYSQMVEMGMREGMNNMIQKVDMNQLGEAKFYMELLEYIVNTARESLGITRQRLGQTRASEGVGAVESSISQSSNSTEMLFWEFEQLESRVLHQILDMSKYAFINGKKAQFVRDDYSIADLNLDDDKNDFLITDFGVTVVKSTQESKNLELLKQAGVNLASQGNRPSVIAEIIEANNYKKIKKILKEIEKRDMEMAQANAQSEQEAQQAQIKIQQEMAQILETIKTEGKIAVDTNKIQLETEKEKIIETIKGEYRALEYALKEPQDSDGDGKISEAEMNEFILKRQQLMQGAREKTREQDIKIAEMQTNAAIKKAELESREKIEKYKGEVALKNKVVGEK